MHLFYKPFNFSPFHPFLQYLLFVSTFHSLTNGTSQDTGALLKGVQYGSRFERKMECFDGVGNNGKASPMWREWQRSQKPLQPGQWPTWQREKTWNALKTFQQQLENKHFLLNHNFLWPKRRNKRLLCKSKPHVKPYLFGQLFVWLFKMLQKKKNSSPDSALKPN